MEYKLKTMPSVVYWLETKQFTVEDKDGNELEVRIADSSKDTQYWIWKNGWEELEDKDLYEWLLEGMPNEEYLMRQEIDNKNKN